MLRREHVSLVASGDNIESMRVVRILTNLAADPERIAEAKRFYGEVFGLDVLMDMGWIATYGSNAFKSAL